MVKKCPEIEVIMPWSTQWCTTYQCCRLDRWHRANPHTRIWTLCCRIRALHPQIGAPCHPHGACTTGFGPYATSLSPTARSGPHVTFLGLMPPPWGLCCLLRALCCLLGPDPVIGTPGSPCLAPGCKTGAPPPSSGSYMPGSDPRPPLCAQ